MFVPCDVITEMPVRGEEEALFLGAAAVITGTIVTLVSAGLLIAKRPRAELLGFIGLSLVSIGTVLGYWRTLDENNPQLGLIGIGGAAAVLIAFGLVAWCTKRKAGRSTQQGTKDVEQDDPTEQRPREG